MILVSLEGSLPTTKTAKEMSPCCKKEVTLIVVSSLFLFEDREINHPRTIWMTHWSLEEEMSFSLNDPHTPHPMVGVDQVLFNSLATKGKFSKITNFFRSRGINRVSRIDSHKLKDWIRKLPNGGTRMPISSVFSGITKKQEDPTKTFGCIYPETELPKIVVLGVNQSAILPEAVESLLFRFYSTKDLGRIEEIPQQAKLVVMTTNGSDANTILKMKTHAKSVGAKFIELGGGTGEFNRWLQRVDIHNEIGGNEKIMEKLKRGGLTSLLSRILPDYTDSDGNTDFDGLLNEVRKTVPDYTKSKLYSAVLNTRKKLERNQQQPEGSLGAKAASDKSVLELLHEAESKFQEGLSLVQRAKEEVSTKLGKLQELGPLLDALEAYKKSSHPDQS